MSDTVIPFPPRADAPVTTLPQMSRFRAATDEERRALNARLEAGDFDRHMRQCRVPKSEDLDSAARLEAAAALLAREADILRAHYRSDDFLALREMQSTLETMAARIRADWE